MRMLSIVLALLLSGLSVLPGPAWAAHDGT